MDEQRRGEGHLETMRYETWKLAKEVITLSARLEEGQREMERRWDALELSERQVIEGKIQEVLLEWNFQEFVEDSE